MSTFLFLLFYFFISHWLMIGFGFILFYGSRKLLFKQIGWSCVAMGLAPMFGKPKALHEWVAKHCYANPIHIPDKRCTYWTCGEYHSCEYSKRHSDNCSK